jgi:hypothetical protein
MRTYARLVGLLLGALALVAATVLLLPRQPTPPHAAAAPAAPARAAGRMSTTPAPALPLSAGQQIPPPTPLRAAAAPLPELELPLRAILAGLEARARAGDAPAACRVAAEFGGCAMLSMHRAEADRWLADRQLALKLIDSAQLRSEAAARIEREMDGRMQQVDFLTRHCEGVQLPSPAENIANWRRAARLGNPAAVKQYASGNAFRGDSVMQALPALETYRHEGEALALAQARGGDVELALALAAAYDAAAQRPRSLLSQIVAPDPAMSLAIYLKLERELAESRDARLDELRGTLQSRRTELEARLGENELAKGRSPGYGGIEQWQHAVVNGGAASLRPGAVRNMPPLACAWDN